MWIQDWSGKITTDFGTRVFWNWRWNETWYPDLDFVVKELDDQGVKVTVYLTGRFATVKQTLHWSVVNANCLSNYK